MATMHIDPDKEATYPVVLSDALMGRGTKALITGIRYNHKESPNSALHNHTIKSTASTAYDLSFSDDKGKYEYQGTLKPTDEQYVLIFDPVKRHFVIHQVDSAFDFNLTSVPWQHEPGSLQDNYEQLQTGIKQPRRKSTAAQRGRITKASAPKEATKRKASNAKKKAPRKAPTPEPEDEDLDDVLTIEYPGGKAPPKYGRRSSPIRKPISTLAVNDESDADADADPDDDYEANRDVDMLQLGSPAANMAPNHVFEDDNGLELDLEAELEQAFEKDESSESEEE